MAASAITQRVDQKRERGGGLAAARIVEVIARERRAPVFEHPHEPPVGDVSCGLVLEHAGEAEAGDHGAHDLRHIVERQLAFDPNPEFAPPLLQFPGIEAARRGEAKIDALVEHRQVDELSTLVGYLSAMIKTSKSIYRGYRFPAEVIKHAVWLYFRFPLSLRMVEDLLSARGIIVYRTPFFRQAVGLRGAPEGLVVTSGASVVGAAVAVLLDQPLGVVAGDCQQPSSRGLIYSWCKLRDNGEANLLKMLEVRTSSATSVMMVELCNPTRSDSPAFSAGYGMSSPSLCTESEADPLNVSRPVQFFQWLRFAPNLRLCS